MKRKRFYKKLSILNWAKKKFTFLYLNYKLFKRKKNF
jgi:hypothetical protein